MQALWRVQARMLARIVVEIRAADIAVELGTVPWYEYHGTRVRTYVRTYIHVYVLEYHGTRVLIMLCHNCTYVRTRVPTTHVRTIIMVPWYCQYPQYHGTTCVP